MCYVSVGNFFWGYDFVVGDGFLVGVGDVVLSVWIGVGLCGILEFCCVYFYFVGVFVLVDCLGEVGGCVVEEWM